jgi:hypothetical protein
VVVRVSLSPVLRGKLVGRTSSRLGSQGCRQEAPGEIHTALNILLLQPDFPHKNVREYR